MDRLEALGRLGGLFAHNYGFVRIHHDVLRIEIPIHDSPDGFHRLRGLEETELWFPRVGATHGIVSTVVSTR